MSKSRELVATHDDKHFRMQARQGIQAAPFLCHWRFWSAAASLVVSLICACSLLFQRLGETEALSLSKSPPAIEYFISIVACSYFVAMVVTWLTLIKEEHVPTALIRIAHCGAIGSVGLLIYLVVNHPFSVSLVMSLGSGLAFYWLALGLPQSTRFGSKVTFVATSLFCLVAVGLYVAKVEMERVGREQLAIDRFEQRTTQLLPTRNDEPNFTDKTLSEAEAVEPQQPSAISDSLTANSRKENGKQAYHGHRRGPSNAVTELVFYCDYDSQDCRRIHQELADLLQRHGETAAVIVRHYPASANGNVSLESALKPGLCRSARIAEAAFQLQGEPGFWKLHDWLLRRESSAQPFQLEQLASLLQVDPSLLSQAMEDPHVVTRILSDILDSRSKGVFGAPALTLNGQRLSQLDSNSLRNAVNSVFAKKGEATSQALPKVTQAIDASATSLFAPQMQIAASLATVRIVNPQGGATGSGVLFARRGPFVYVLTAAHLVGPSGTVSVQTFSEESYPTPDHTYAWSTVVASSPSSDVAVLRFSAQGSVPTPLKIHSAKKFVEGKFVEGQNLICLTIGCNQSDSPPTCALNEVTTSMRVRKNASEDTSLVWETSNESIEGRSGGALIDQSGLVLGIASGNNAGKGYFSHIEEIHRLLEAHGLNSLVEDR